MADKISFKERFIGLPNPATRGLYAPMTIGAPVYLNTTDYKAFKKTKEEKMEVNIVKSQHKKELLKVYGKGNIGRRMNISILI